MAGAVLLTGCSDDGDTAQDVRDRAKATAAQKLSEGAARDSTDLLRRYDATLTAHPGLEARLRPLRTQVAAHAAAFRDAGPREGTPSAGASAASRSPGTAAGATSGASVAASAPAKEKDALRALAEAERQLADRRGKALVSAPGELARLLASVAASGAAHVYLLTEGGK